MLIFPDRAFHTLLRQCVDLRELVVVHGLCQRAMGLLEDLAHHPMVEAQVAHNIRTLIEVQPAGAVPVVAVELPQQLVVAHVHQALADLRHDRQREGVQVATHLRVAPFAAGHRRGLVGLLCCLCGGVLVARRGHGAEGLLQGRLKLRGHGGRRLLHKRLVVPVAPLVLRHKCPRRSRCAQGPWGARRGCTDKEPQTPRPGRLAPGGTYRNPDLGAGGGRPYRGALFRDHPARTSWRYHGHRYRGRL
mmetsp:Transcript_3468/g.10050  ORF Transcript_3468/g.10050 Transcript_3468/m.10050 type:complete len:247 (-) Transcript_3468:652-1392(-)